MATLVRALSQRYTLAVSSSDRPTFEEFQGWNCDRISRRQRNQRGGNRALPWIARLRIELPDKAMNYDEGPPSTTGFSFRTTVTDHFLWLGLHLSSLKTFSLLSREGRERFDLNEILQTWRTAKNIRYVSFSNWGNSSLKDENHEVRLFKR